MHEEIPWRQRLRSETPCEFEVSHEHVLARLYVPGFDTGIFFIVVDEFILSEYRDRRYGTLTE